MRSYAKKAYKNRGANLQTQMISLFRNFRLSLVSAKSYDDICMLVAFLSRLTSIKSFSAVPPSIRSERRREADAESLCNEGEQIIWKHLGGVPTETDPNDAEKLRVRAGISKGYYPSYFEEARLSDQGKRSENVRTNYESQDRSDHHVQLIPDLEEDSEFVPELANVLHAEKGVFTHSLGPFDIHVVFREKSEGKTHSRYRVYIPSLSLLPKSLAGFNVWCEFLQKDETIVKELFMGGRQCLYLQKQWFSNLAFICPVFTGIVPLTHNTPVGVSYKLKKHHEDLGSDAFNRSGGMRIAEYVKKAAIASKSNARRIIPNLVNFYKKKRSERRRSEKSNSHLLQPLKTINKEKKITLSSVAQGVNHIYANKQKDKSVFKRTVESKIVTRTGTVLQEGKEIQTALTQQSQSEIAEIEESWNKSKKLRTGKNSMSSTDIEDVKNSLSIAVKSTFEGWKISRIANFFSAHVLNSIGKSIDKSVVSRLLSGKITPGTAIMLCLKSFLENEAEGRTVEDEDDSVVASVLPGAKRRVEELVSHPRDWERHPYIITEYGDSKVTLNDLQRLVRPRNWKGSDEELWITDDCVNMMTNLFFKLRPASYTYYFSTLLIQSIVEIYHGKGSFVCISENDRRKKFERIVGKKTTARSGQAHSFAESEKAFAPCNVLNLHWVGFRLERRNMTVTCVDSLGDALSQNQDYITAVHEAGTAITSFATQVDGEQWKWAGSDRKFPQQSNKKDCGPVVLLEARNYILGFCTSPIAVREESIAAWRVRFAHEIIVLRCT